VNRKMGIHWHLRGLMATKGMYMTSDLVPKLTERGVELSREQVYRLVTHQPERLNVYVLAALCDILECTPNDLIEPVVERGTVRKKAVAEGTTADVRALRPTRARITNKP
jgi:DNA-binding Xre family transcriptional regulator